jgi:hypothetical protein
VFKRIEAKAARAGASGLISVRYDQRIERLELEESPHDILITLHVLGTGIVQTAQPKAEGSQLTKGMGLRLSLMLNDDRDGVTANFATDKSVAKAQGRETEKLSAVGKAQRLGRLVAGRFARRTSSRSSRRT